MLKRFTWMSLGCGGTGLLLWTALSTPTQLTPPDIPMRPLAGGTYYVGMVHGQHDYGQHANTHIDPREMMQYEMTCGWYEAIRIWAQTQGYSNQISPCHATEMQEPVQGINWWDAILIANALSEWQDHTPYYLATAGEPLRQRPPQSASYSVRYQPQADGYRLPTYAEWQIAARGGQVGLHQHSYGDVFAGSQTAADVAWFPNNAAGKVHPVGQKRANELGLYDLNGNVDEWLDTTMHGLPNMAYFCGGRYDLAVNSLSQCDSHSRGFREDGLGFRLIKPTTLDAK